MHKFPMGGGGWFYVPKVRIPEAFLAAMLCAMLSFGVGYGWRLHGWARGRTQARGAKPKASTTKRNARWSRCWWLVGRSWCIPFDGHRGHYLRRSSFLVDGVSFGDCWHGWSAPLLMKQFDQRLDVSGKIRVAEATCRRDGGSVVGMYLYQSSSRIQTPSGVHMILEPLDKERAFSSTGAFFVTPSRCGGFLFLA